MRATTLCIAFSAAAGMAHAAELGAADDPIKLAINEWTGQHITTHIAGEMLKEAGYTVEYTTAGYSNMYQAMAEGEIHAAVEIWSNTVPDDYARRVDAGTVTEIGSLGLDAREGIVYPSHVEDICPGLPAWEALNDCAQKFASAETLPQGRLVDYPAEWGTPGADRIEGLDLPFKAVPAGSEGALIAELRASAEKKSPLLMVFWQPHWAISAYDMRFVDLPESNDQCFQDPSWGPNPNATHDCDMGSARVFKASWSGFEEKWPVAYEILSELKLSVEEQQPLMGKVDVDGMPVEKVVATWMTENEAQWRPVVEAATR